MRFLLPTQRVSGDGSGGPEHRTTDEWIDKQGDKEDLNIMNALVRTIHYLAAPLAARSSLPVPAAACLDV